MEYGYLGDIELGLTEDDARYVSQQGQCDTYVMDVSTEEYMIDQLAEISDESLIAALSEVGAWEEEELQDRESNEYRLIWIIGNDITEELHTKE